MLKSVVAAFALLSFGYAVEIDHIDDDGEVRTYVVDHGLTFADCAEIKASLDGWHRAASVRCVLEVRR